MKLNEREEAILNGKEGEVKAKIMRTLVKYGDIFGAEKMVDITPGTKGHLVTSFGLSVMKPVYALMDEIILSGVKSSQPFSVDPLPLDSNVPQSLVQKLFFKIMYGMQSSYNEQLKALGLLDEKAFTCTCYLDEVGNTPKRGDILSWAESSAVVYANSVLGARCNRNSGIIDLFGSIVGSVPFFGLLTDEGRKADYLIEVKTEKLPEAQLLGSAIGLKVMEETPYIVGLDKYFMGLDDSAKAYLKDMGSGAASNGAVGLYHVENITPEAVDYKRALLKEGYKTYVIDDQELERVLESYPVIWKNPDSKAKVAFVGCPHLTEKQLFSWAERIEAALKKNGRKKTVIPLVITAAPAVLEKFRKNEAASRLESEGVVLSYICPLMYMNNPECKKMPTITSSNKLRTYTSSRYMKEEDLIEYVTGGKHGKSI